MQSPGKNLQIRVRRGTDLPSFQNDREQPRHSSSQRQVHLSQCCTRNFAGGTRLPLPAGAAVFVSAIFNLTNHPTRGPILPARELEEVIRDLRWRHRVPVQDKSLDRVQIIQRHVFVPLIGMESFHDSFTCPLEGLAFCRRPACVTRVVIPKPDVEIISHFNEL